MNILALTYCALLFIHDAELNLLYTWNLKSYLNNIIDNHGDSSGTMKPKNLIVYIVDKAFLRSYEFNNLRSGNNKTYLLEPYKSLAGDDRKIMKNLKKVQRASKQTDSASLEAESEEVLRDLNLTEEQKQMLRKTWFNSFSKKACRTCKKACRHTYKNVCRAYKCFKSQKHMFKRECSRNCKMKFTSSLSI